MEIEVEEMFPVALDPEHLLKWNGENEQVKGAAIRSLKEVYHFYDYLEVAIKNKDNDKAVAWGKDQLIINFESPETDSIAFCCHGGCHDLYKDHSQHCSFSVKDYVETVLDDTNKDFETLSILAETPQLVEVIEEEDGLKLLIQIEQPYVGEKPGKEVDHSDPKTFTLTAKVRSFRKNGKEQFAITKITFKGMTAECITKCK